MECIYCGEKKVSKSDIFPSALTNTKIISYCCCERDHNNKFSDKFESETITALGLFTNHLDIRSGNSKHKSKPKFPCIVVHNGKEKRIMTTSFNAIKDITLRRPLDQKISKNGIEYQLFNGTKEEVEKKKQTAKNYIELPEVEEHYYIPPELGFINGEKTKRLACKIAFEYFCKIQKIDKFYPDIFGEIITYICDGIESGNKKGNREDKKIVEVVKDNEFYVYLSKSMKQGTNFIYFRLEDDTYYSYVSFYNLFVYRVKLCKFSDLPNSFDVVDSLDLLGVENTKEERYFNRVDKTGSLLPPYYYLFVRALDRLNLMKEFNESEFKHRIEEFCKRKYINVRILRRFIKDNELYLKTKKAVNSCKIKSINTGCSIEDKILLLIIKCIGESNEKISRELIKNCVDKLGGNKLATESFHPIDGAKKIDLTVNDNDSIKKGIIKILECKFTENYESSFKNIPCIYVV